MWKSSMWLWIRNRAERIDKKMAMRTSFFGWASFLLNYNTIKIPNLGFLRNINLSINDLPRLALKLLIWRLIRLLCYRCYGQFLFPLIRTTYFLSPSIILQYWQNWCDRWPCIMIIKWMGLLRDNIWSYLPQYFYVLLIFWFRQ